MGAKYNYLGQLLTNKYPSFSDPSYGYVSSDGKVIVNWEKENEFVDSNGFDKNHQEDNGSYIQEVILPIGTQICRFGNESGKMTAPKGTPYELVALPYVKETVEYHEYVVIAEGLRVSCVVTKGKTYKMFDSPGGATQYKHTQAIRREVADGKVKEVFEWINTLNKHV